MSKFTDPIRNLRRCRFCGLDTIEERMIDTHEDNCTDNPENHEVEPIDPEGDRGPCYEPDGDEFASWEFGISVAPESADDSF